MNKLQCMKLVAFELRCCIRWLESHSWGSKSGHSRSRSFVMERSDDESVEFMSPANRGFQAPAPWLALMIFG